MNAMHVDMGEIENEPVRPKMTDAKGILQQNREFQDFFWDIAKPEQEIRLKAIENLIQYLKTSQKTDELTYTPKRLVDGLAHTREAGLPGFSLALGQVLSVFEEVPLRTAFDQIKEKHNLANVKKDPQVVLECVQLLQSLSQYRELLRDLPRKTMVDILSETSEEVFEEVLLGALQTDLSSAFSTPEQLQLLLVAMQKFPQVLKLKKLKKLLGTSTIITMDNIPNYLSYRLLGSALPLLTLAQLKQVLNGEVMRAYGEHVVSAQLLDRFKFAPEMETYIGDFLQGCDDPEKQLAVMVAFSLLTNQGYPVVPSFWRVVQHLQPTALQSYVDWLKDMFLNPRLDSCLDFSTRRQKENQEGGVQRENCIFRLRKWIIPRLTSIAENNQVKREEALVMDVARFVFFHAFFNAKKATPDILETVPLDEKARVVIINSFFGFYRRGGAPLG